MHLEMCEEFNLVPSKVTIWDPRFMLYAAWPLQDIYPEYSGPVNVPFDRMREPRTLVDEFMISPRELMDRLSSASRYS